MSILEFCYVIKNKSTFPNENVGNALTNDRKSKEISNNFGSRRHQWSVEDLNRTSFQACDSGCNKSKSGLDMKFFLVSFIFLQFSQINLAQNGQMLYDNQVHNVNMPKMVKYVL